MSRILSARVLPWVLFTVSLALNAFFVGGHVYGRYYATEIYAPSQIGASRQERRQRIIEKLKLTEAQQEAFTGLRKEMIARGRALREKNKDPMAALWDEISAPKSAEDRIATLLSTMSENRLAYHLDATRLTQNFMAELSPDQRETFVEMARKRNLLARNPESRWRKRNRRPERRPAE